MQHVQDLSVLVRDRLLGLQQRLPIIREIRVRGMMIGIDLTIPSAPAVAKCMERGVLINATNETVVRLLPALNVTESDLMEGVEIVEEVLEQMAGDV